jgi:hypothetical protein
MLCGYRRRMENIVLYGKLWCINCMGHYCVLESCGLRRSRQTLIVY